VARINARDGIIPLAMFAIRLNWPRGHTWRVAGAILVGFLQAWYVFYFDRHPQLKFGVGLMYPNLIMALMSSLVIAMLAFTAGSDSRTLLSRMARAIIIGFIASFFWFEGCYLISRLPAISDVSICLSFRPWFRILPSSTAVCVLVSLGSFLSMAGPMTDFERLVRLGEEVLHRRPTQL
jgi:hypothetical protein